MHKSLRHTALALSAVAALLLAGGAPAFAAETEDYSGPGENPPAVQAEIDRLTAEGAEIIKVSTTPYVAEETPGTVSTMSAYPSGCGLSVIISKFGFGITGSSISSCWSGGSFTSNTMNSTMTHYNPDWNVWDSTVATGSKTTGLSS
ncbi:hypothetical protein, partial [Microbacterium sp. 13-71-7]|uniref:hypothetical protein n=1 Tax=Microbacterium sp. 13-71-7 TaxID=1970399 RepID=UPI000BC5FFE2